MTNPRLESLGYFKKTHFSNDNGNLAATGFRSEADLEQDGYAGKGR
jgi:hypothetical protein